jgi:hypothetical protein
MWNYYVESDRRDHRVTLKDRGPLAFGEGKALEPTAAAVPMIWPSPSEGAPKPSTSKEEWVGEWLCS